jgi:hypothetical protein
MRLGIGVLIAAAVVALMSQAAVAQSFDDCGRLVQGIECVLFERDGGDLYVLDDTGGFAVGSRVRVVGAVDADCVSICQQGRGCITVSRITYCDGPITTCGRLVDGVTCVLLEDDCGRLLVIDETGDFQVGQRVEISGTFDGDCLSICLEAAGCVRGNTIRAAPAGCACGRSGGGGGGIVCPAISGGLLILFGAALVRGRRC